MAGKKNSPHINDVIGLPQICHALTHQGRWKTLLHHGLISEQEYNELETINVTSDKAKEALKKLKIVKDEKGGWEATYIQDFTKIIKNEVGKTTLSRLFGKHNVTEAEFVKGKYEWIYRLNSDAVSDETALNLFSALREARGYETDSEILLAFLIFCANKNDPKPLAAFNYDNTKLLAAIEKIQNPDTNKASTEEKEQNFYNINLEMPPEMEGNINYYNTQIIKVIGRDKEQKKLREFLKCDKSFAWFQLAGVAGQGKSRLALDLVLKVKQKGWNAGLLERDELEKMEEQWENWQPKKPHLIVIDYVVSKLDLIGSCLRELARRRDSFQHPVRLLLLERQPWNQGYLKNIRKSDASGEALSYEFSSSYAEWFCNLADRPDGHDVSISKARFDTGIEKLEKLTPDNLFKIVKKVGAHSAGTSTLPSTKEIKKQLHHIDKEGRPLYAYFLAQELSEGKDTKVWSKEDLLTAALEREYTRWWPSVFEEETPEIGDDREVSRVALLATMIGGLNYKKAIREKAINKLTGKEQHQALRLVGGHSEKSAFSPNIIPAMQPDILAEWYIVSSFNEVFPMDTLFKTAWENYPKEIANFVLKLIQDFSDQPVNEAILEALDLEQINTLAIADVVNQWLVAYDLKECPIPQKAIDILEANSNRCHIPSKTQLGWCYGAGINFEHDFDKAVALFKEAAAKKDTNAKLYLGIFYEYGMGVKKNINEAITLLDYPQFSANFCRGGRGVTTLLGQTRLLNL